VLSRTNEDSHVGVEPGSYFVVGLKLMRGAPRDSHGSSEQERCGNTPKPVKRHGGNGQPMSRYRTSPETL